MPRPKNTGHSPIRPDRAGDPHLALVVDAMRARPRGGEACPACGWTAQRARETGLLGCPLCYVSLASRVSLIDAPAD